MARRDDFDRFPSIDYQDIKTLYWNKFPYKVMVRDQIERPTSTSCIDKKTYKEWEVVHSNRQKFYYARKRHCPTDRKTWKSMNNGGETFSFFFVTETDALHFIEGNRKHIKTVFRPDDAKQIDVLLANRRLVIRDQLYNGVYRYCVEFKEQYKLPEEEKLDTAIESLFPTKNETRFSYHYDKRRRLFLNDERDVIFVKLGLHEKIRAINQAVLRSEI